MAHWITSPAQKMKRVLQSRDKRTVRRRLARLRERAAELRITPADLLSGEAAAA
jgi:hypothetical protein